MRGRVRVTAAGFDEWRPLRLEHGALHTVHNVMLKVAFTTSHKCAAVPRRARI